MKKLVYSFGNMQAEGNGSMKDLLGGKGANLAEMCLIDMPVPPGFTITTEVCTYYYAHKKSIPNELKDQVASAIKNIENSISSKFGDKNNPLLVSVRSGAKASMPGMMDTVLNLGLNDETVEGLAKVTSNPRFAYDSYRRFIQMYSDVVLDVSHDIFEEILDHKKRMKNIHNDTDLTTEDLKDIVSSYKKKVKEETGKAFPNDVNEQLWGAIHAVFASWMNQRAITYRKLNNISDDIGTAVNIQSMVFGNMGDDSATGVAFTRDPSTGEKIFYGEFLVNAQGEDVVAGIRTPASITLRGKKDTGSKSPALEELMPEIFAELTTIYKKLEQHYKDMQDIEFTIQKGKLWILQTRSGKRSAEAAIRIAVEMVHEKLISKEEALMRVNPYSLDKLLHPTLDTSFAYTLLDKGLPASPGAASGRVVFSAEDAEAESKLHPVILVRTETSPEDINGMHVSAGILTSRGGMTSHAAVVARGMGKTCICGASGIIIDYQHKLFTAHGKTVKEGDIITINGSTGEIILGEVPTIQPKLSEHFKELMQYADEVRYLKVRTNAETPKDALVARQFGAEGIGLCRTEHMFFDGDRINAMREMILAHDMKGRKAALEKLFPMQVKDFMEIFEVMDGLPCNIRLLDPPLHEFLPHLEADIHEVAKSSGISPDAIHARSLQLKESNPMLGHRGCRLGITYPEIYQMQAEAIFIAMVEVHAKLGRMPIVEIMIPLVMDVKEFSFLKEKIVSVAAHVEKVRKTPLKYQIGTMIELPRAALMAHHIAVEAEFFSFGTNDLTQTTLGISRDDASNFIEEYKEKGLVKHDPFVRIDEEGVGQLIEMATTKGRNEHKKLKIGICGEHGGNPESIEFCAKLDMDYVSCSPYRVPIARLAAAQAAIKLAAIKKKVAA